MLRLRAKTIRATGAKDDLVREARRLGDVVTNLPRVDRSDVAEASREIDGATAEIGLIARLTASIEEGEPDERAAISQLTKASSAARERRRRLRAIRRRLLSEQSFHGELAA